MKPHVTNLLNSIVLIGVGLWGYFETSSPTAFILVGFGVVLLLLNGGVKKENKVIAHIAVVLTLIVLLAMGGRLLPKAIDEGGLKLIRAVLPTITSVLALFSFIKSFIDARKARTGG